MSSTRINQKQQVYRTLSNHPGATVKGVSSLLSIREKRVRKLIRLLRQEGVIDDKRKPKPMFTQLSLYND